MMWLVLRGLRTRPGRAILTGLVAAVGVAMVTGALMVAAAAGPGSDLDPIRPVMLTAGAVAALVGAFVAHVTAAVTVGRRTQEMGLLRCVGAHIGQVRRIVVAEALITGVSASGIGLALGIGVAVALRALINAEVVPGRLTGSRIAVTPVVVVMALVAGCVPLVLSALGPARQAGRISPVAASVVQSSPSPRRLGRPRLIAGVSLVAAGVAVTPLAVATDQGLLLLPGAAAVLFGVRLTGPAFVGGFTRFVAAPVALVFGVPGDLGRTNAARNRQRTAATAAALMIGVALVTLVNVLYASARAPMMAEFARDRADFQLWADDPVARLRGGPMPADLPDRVRAVSNVATVATLRCVSCEQSPIYGADPAAAAMFGLKVTAGDPSHLRADQIALSDAQARRLGAMPGSRITLSTVDYTVAATYADTVRFAWPLMTAEGMARLPGTPAPSTVYVQLADGADAADATAVRAALVGIASADPKIGVHSRAELHRHDLDMMARAAALFRALATMAGLLGLAGVTGTLALSIVERRREIGMARAVGMQRRQVGHMVYAEALSVVLTGTALGCAIGVLFGWAGATVLDSPRQPSEFTLPIGSSIAIVIAAGVAGILAAVIPARLAARTAVLRTIDTW